MGKDNPKKSAYAMAFAAALGFLAVHNMDKVSFHLMKGNRSENPFGTIIGKTPYFRAIGEMEKMEFVEDTDIESCVTSCQDTGTNNGLSVIISDFFTESNWKKAVDYLCYKKRQVLLVQIMTPEEIDPTYDGRVQLIDSESEDLMDSRNMRMKITRSMQKAYEEAMNDFREDLDSRKEELNVSFMNYRSNESEGFYSGFFGKIEGWLVIKILNFRKKKYEEYERLERQITMKLTGIIYRLSI
jgi:hypothetical protein